MAEKQSNKDRLKEITNSIENGIKELFESEKYKGSTAQLLRQALSNHPSGRKP